MIGVELPLEIGDLQIMYEDKNYLVYDLTHKDTERHSSEIEQLLLGLSFEIIEL